MVHNARILIEYKKLIGICACLRQMDLSIDRCRWTSWSELQRYYETRTEENKVIEFFLHQSEKLGIAPVDHKIYPNVFIRQRYILRLLRRKHFISVQEFETLIFLLATFKRLIKLNDPDASEVELLRIKVASFIDDVLIPGMKRNDIRIVWKIEHYLQNENIETVPFGKIVNERW